MKHTILSENDTIVQAVMTGIVIAIVYTAAILYILSNLFLDKIKKPIYKHRVKK